MSRAFSKLVLAALLAVPMAAGCVVRGHPHAHGGPPPHARGWRSAPPPGRVPPGQIRRAEVHERNDQRKAARMAEKDDRRGGHGRGRGRGNGRD